MMGMALRDTRFWTVGKRGRRGEVRPSEASAMSGLRGLGLVGVVGQEDCHTFVEGDRLVPSRPPRGRVVGLVEGG
jgi:hypothetical protein